MPAAPKTRAATRPADVPPVVRHELNAGTRETRKLAEGLAVDFAALLLAAAPELPAAAHARMQAMSGGGVTRRCALAGELLLAGFGPGGFGRFSAHASDTVRGWAAYLLAATPGLPLAARLKKIRALADDPHFGVREWAWLAQRPAVAAEPAAAIRLLTPWTAEASPNLRRFATEVTRPRGVWCAHLSLLKERPELGLPLLDPLRADPERYVQNSVANWLNDAAKSRPDFVRELCARWRKESPGPATDHIRRRALRSVR
ncbi:MAG: DNA alkylation repair protein [Limisphaerales bacterium]